MNYEGLIMHPEEQKTALPICLTSTEDLYGIWRYDFILHNSYLIILIGGGL